MSISRTLSLPYASTSVAVARDYVRDDLLARDLPEHVVENAALVTSELTGNAVRHAHPMPDGRIRMDWRVAEDRVELWVSDGGSRSYPARHTPASTAAQGGRGLGIVDYLAGSWGVREDDTATTVWVVLPYAVLVDSEV